MFTIQNALIKHLQNGTHEYFNLLRKANIKAYAGELTKEKIVQLSQNLPAVMVICQPSLPCAPDSNLNLDVIIVTASDSFDKTTNTNNNMQLSEEIYTYLKDEPIFEADENNNYKVEFENLEIKIVAIDNKHCVVILGVNITQLEA